MVFELQDSISAAILYAMENQERQFAFDVASGMVVPAETVTVDEETVYSLPQWTSADGFNVLESFVFSLGESKAKSELKQVLVAGRGVFRNFKNVLKTYPEVERRWHLYKDKQLHVRLMEWYNALRESWGLEALEQDFEEYDDLTEQDFTFGTFDADSDAALVTKQAHAVAEELSKAYSGGLGLAMQTVFLQSSASAAATLKDGYLCRSLTNDFAGCLLYAPCPSSAKDTVILTDFFVAQNYRGLGIARELLQLSFLRLKQRGVHWFIIANTAIPPSLDPLVTRMGFERRGIVLVADITKL